MRTHFTELPGRRASLLFTARAYQRPEYAALWKTLPPDPPSADVLRTLPIHQPLLWVRQPTAARLSNSALLVSCAAGFVLRPVRPAVGRGPGGGTGKSTRMRRTSTDRFRRAPRTLCCRKPLRLTRMAALPLHVGHITSLAHTMATVPE